MACERIENNMKVWGWMWHTNSTNNNRSKTYICSPWWK